MARQFLFRDRAGAGRVLGGILKPVIPGGDLIVLALPRGGVPVGFEVAEALHADLDVFLVRKLGVPGQEELAMGALASGGVRVLNEKLIEHLGIPDSVIDQIAAREQREIERREHLYRDGRSPQPVQGRTVILVDDGLATGATMLAAAIAVRESRPKQIVVAVPVASRETCDDFRKRVDRVVCAATPEPFSAVGEWYEHFTQTTDEEVQQLLARAAREHRPRDVGVI
ncbi:MAG: phosphoribosyltransferase [Bryobacterales bacterium]|nr:phosphoribosyltransferase [Bryobacterales bacterium]MBV9399081.1 phosphoribosyltransferase [Bryobacterales bacterium]